jgi:DNA polymerase-3 subunit delta
MISDRQLIIVKEAQNLSRSIEQLLEYSKQPQKSTTIVFCYKYKSLDKRKALYKSLSKTNVVFESKKVYESNIPSWIANQLKIKGYNITPKSSHLLCEYLGNDLTKITNELDKLILVVEEDKMITDQTIESNIGISKDFNNFELQNAIASNNYSKAFQIVQYFSKNPKKHSIILTISTLYSFFVKIMKLHTIATNDPKIVASSIGVNPYFLKDYLKAKDFFSMHKISSVFETLREIDMKSKGVDSNLNSKELYSELLIKIFNN